MKKSIICLFTALTLCGCGDIGTASSGAVTHNAPGNESSISDTTAANGQDREPDEQQGQINSAAADSTTAASGINDEQPQDQNGSENDDPIEGQIVVCHDVPPETIVLVERYSNYAWGYEDKGYFYTLDGKGYKFDFGSGDYSKQPPENFLAALEEIRDSEDPVKQVNSSVMDECLSYAFQVNPDSEYPKKNTACDAGQSTIYCVVNGEMIELRTFGDYTGERSDSWTSLILDRLESGGVAYTGRNDPEYGGESSNGIRGLLEKIF